MALFASDFDLTILYRLKCLYRQNEQKRKGNLVSLAFCVLLKHLKHQFWKKKELVRRAKIKLTQITNALLCIFCQKLRRRWGLNFDILWMTLVLLLLLFPDNNRDWTKNVMMIKLWTINFLRFCCRNCKTTEEHSGRKISKYIKPTNTLPYLKLDFTIYKYYF